MGWKTDPTDGHVAGTLTLRDSSPLDQVEVTLEPVIGDGEPVSSGCNPAPSPTQASPDTWRCPTDATPMPVDQHPKWSGAVGAP